MGTAPIFIRCYAVSTLLTRSDDDSDVLFVYFQDVRIIDESRINSLGQDLTSLINDSDNTRVVLNFQNVSFMSSAMIGKLVQFGKTCKAAKVQLKMCKINENIEEVFDLMKLNQVFDIKKDEAAAIKSFSKKSWFGK